AMNQQASLLTRMKELATQAANGTYAGGDLTNIKTEFDQLIDEVDRIAQSTKFNNTALLDGSTASLALQVGTTSAASDQISVTLSATDKTTLQIASLDVAGAPTAALDAIDIAITTLATAQANVGAIENRLT